MSDRRTARDSIRPPLASLQEVSGLDTAGVEVEKRRRPEFEVVEEAQVAERAKVDEVSAEVLGVGADDGDELVATEEEEPAERLASLPCPYQPTRSEFLSHCVTHYPYQSWCPHCNDGRGAEFGHASRPKSPSALPIISFDYCFLSDGADIEDQEQFEAAGESPCCPR